MRLKILLLFIMCSMVVAAQKKTLRTNNYELVKTPKYSKCSLSSITAIRINQAISEGSGLICHNGLLWTHNDSGKPQLFGLDTASGKIIKEFELPVKVLKDWEDMSQDSIYFYVGAFGNNSGKKDTLQILRLLKPTTKNKKIAIDSITFSWPKIEHKRKNKRINYDCEAMVIIGDSIYLFTKEWKNGKKTKVFSVTKKAGHHIARYKFTLQTNIMVTGASFESNKKQLVLCGHNFLLRPYLIVFENIDGTNFFDKDGIKIKIKGKMRQVEGVSTFDGKKYFLISERYKFLFFKGIQDISSYQLN